ncbi:MAG: hypothetical protein COB67_00940 [SAR324 cluster bacterium]|uniref:DUF3341 domain-containing protein n=1 Tax=SAR324 cluster bacterium TaxID=2024889 RepID=A0A2A4TB43_9DELT|nr:MAG: hypothetical protein COB67_00940 [SAR324 cluster bacterium]
MSKKFSGVWGTFEFLDDTCSVVKELREMGYKKITTHAPCPRHELDHALGDPQSRVPFATLIGMFTGLGLAVVIMLYMTLDWILPVSGKPIISIPSMGPVAFELTVLTSIYFTMMAMVVLIIKDTKAHQFPQGKQYKEYNRFMRDRFGIVVPCPQGEVEKVESIFKKYQAEEVIREV